MKLLEQLQKEQDQAFEELLDKTQNVMGKLAAARVTAQYYNTHSDQLYNSLENDIATPLSYAYRKRLEQSLASVNKGLTELIKEPDDEKLIRQHSLRFSPPNGPTSELITMPELLSFDSCMRGSSVKK